jgi:hypothetical protein
MASAPASSRNSAVPRRPPADRKAAASRAYRQSKTFRNLVAALLVTMAVVAVVYFGVPRFASRPRADVAAAAQSASASIGHPLLVPVVPENWRANSARLEGSMWRVVYAPPSGYVRVAQGVGVDAGWATKVLGGFAPSGTVTIDGITWDEYTIPPPPAPTRSRTPSRRRQAPTRC